MLGAANIAPPSTEKLPSLDDLTSNAPPPQAAAPQNKRAGITSARPTTQQASVSPSVRAVQGVPVSPYPPGPGGKPAPRLQPQILAEVTEAPTVPSKPPPSMLELRDRLRADPARMVQAIPHVPEAHAIPEVTGSVVDERIHPEDALTRPREYLPGDPMGPGWGASEPPRRTRSSQPPGGPGGSGRPRRPRELQFAAEYDEREQSTYILLYWAVCIAVVVAVAALAFRIL